MSMSIRMSKRAGREREREREKERLNEYERCIYSFAYFSTYLFN